MFFRILVGLWTYFSSWIGCEQAASLLVAADAAARNAA